MGCSENKVVSINVGNSIYAQKLCNPSYGYTQWFNKTLEIPTGSEQRDMELDPKCLSVNATARMLHPVRSILAHRWSISIF